MRKSVGRKKDSSNPTTCGKRSKPHNQEEGTVRLCKKLKSLGEVTYPPKSDYELADSALRDYNEKHGTDLEFLRLLHSKCFNGHRYSVDFAEFSGVLRHFIFEARRPNADPLHEPLLLFAEVYEKGEKYYLNNNTLALVKPADDDEYGPLYCLAYTAHPRYAFRAGFDVSMSSEPKILSEQDAAGLSKFALQDYNQKHGTNLKFERVLGCCSFSCVGLSMDFNEKNTSWVHMNFEARVGTKEELINLFGELYLGENDEYVLATLSPSDMVGGKRKKTALERECVVCPDDICHPFRTYLYDFDYPK